MVKVLLNNGANYNLKSFKDHETALYKAVKNGKYVPTNRLLFDSDWKLKSKTDLKKNSEKSIQLKSNSSVKIISRSCKDGCSVDRSWCWCERQKWTEQWNSVAFCCFKKRYPFRASINSKVCLKFCWSCKYIFILRWFQEKIVRWLAHQRLQVSNWYSL